MAKKKSKQKQSGAVAGQQVVQGYKPSHPPKTVQERKPWSIKGYKVQAIILTLLGLVFYANSISNEYALDDGIVIVRNEYVQEGFAGIPDILSKDAYDSYYRQLNSSNELKGGRYRPLSIVTFAIEQQFMGAQDKDSVEKMLQQYMVGGVKGTQREKLNHEMRVRHALNVVWYILSVLIMLYFLRYIVFRGNPLMAFIAAILFTIHPIHTEVVANVKSRDEIMSLLFICLTFIFTFKYQELRKKWMIAAALGCYFLALLSKEYAITLIVLLPLSLYLFNGATVKKSIFTLVPFVVVLGLYMLLRLQTAVSANDSADNEVLNNPYLFASPSEALATKIYTSLSYLRLLFFPHPLSADYSYNSIPYTDFSNPVVWLSIIVYAGLALLTIGMLRKKQVAIPSGLAKSRIQWQSTSSSILCFGLAFYLLNFLLICNLVFNIGGTMGERLIYHSSLGFVIVAGYGFVRAFEQLKVKQTGEILLAIFIVALVILCGYKTIPRNTAWKNNETLFSTDIKTVPNSVLVNGNVVTYLVNDADSLKDSVQRRQTLEKAITLATHAIGIDPVYVTGYYNRGLAWYKLGEMDKAKADMDSVKAHYINYPLLPVMNKLIVNYYLQKGNDLGQHEAWAQAITEYKKGISTDGTNPELWYNMGVALYALHDLSGAINAWKTTVQLSPGYGPAQQNLNFALQLQKANNSTSK